MGYADQFLLSFLITILKKITRALAYIKKNLYLCSVFQARVQDVKKAPTEVDALALPLGLEPRTP